MLRVYTVQMSLGAIIFGLCVFTEALSSKSLTIAINAEFETLNPITNSMMAAFTILDASVRPLVALDVDGKPKAFLIESIPSIEKKTLRLIGNKGKTIKGLEAQIRFKDSARWGDGQPVTCADLRLAWLVGQDLHVATPNRHEYQNIEKIDLDSKDKKKCKVLFKEAKWNFYLSFPRPIPAHLEESVFQQNKNKALGYERQSLYVTAVGNPGLYNGPYRVTEHKPGSHVILEINSQFTEKKPHFEKIIFKFIPNTSTLEAQLRSGGVDLISSSGFTFDQALTFEKKSLSENWPYKVVYATGAIYSHIDFHLEHPILKDLLVRRALAHAISKDLMAKAFFENKQKIAFHFSSELDSWYTQNPKDFMVYDYSKAKAIQLLEQAGWKTFGSDGIRKKQGQSLTLTLSGAADNKLNEVIQNYLQQAWKEIGVQVLIKNSPARVFLGDQVRHRNFEMALYSFVVTPDASLRESLHSSMIPSLSNGWSGTNRPGWINKNADQWLDQVESEFNPAVRQKLMHKVIRVYTEDLPALPLFNRSNNSVIPAELQNYRLSGHFFTEYLHVEDWTLPVASQNK